MDVSSYVCDARKKHHKWMLSGTIVVQEIKEMHHKWMLSRNAKSGLIIFGWGEYFKKSNFWNSA